MVANKTKPSNYFKLLTFKDLNTPPTINPQNYHAYNSIFSM